MDAPLLVTLVKVTPEPSTDSCAELSKHAALSLRVPLEPTIKPLVGCHWVEPEGMISTPPMMGPVQEGGESLPSKLAIQTLFRY